MDDNSLKSAWQNTPTPLRNQDDIKPLMQEKNQAVIKKVRRQAFIETAGFAISLFVYYDMFDGHNKPLYANALLTASFLLIILHNAAVYLLSRKKTAGDNIKQMLQSNISNLKKHGVVTVALRAVAASCLLLFFVSVISFTNAKYWLLGAIVAVYIVQLWLLAVVQRKRVQQLRQVLKNFGE